MFRLLCFVLLLSVNGSLSIPQSIVCRIDGHNFVLARVLQTNRPVLLLSDDRLQGFHFSPGSFSVLMGGRGYMAIRRPEMNPASSEN